MELILSPEQLLSGTEANSNAVKKQALFHFSAQPVTSRYTSFACQIPSRSPTMSSSEQCVPPTIILSAERICVSEKGKGGIFVVVLESKVTKQKKKKACEVHLR
jgi:hypothetical protein